MNIVSKKNLWIISEFYYPIENATGFILTQIVDKLALNVKVNLITIGSSSHERSNNINAIRVKDINWLNKNKLIQRAIKQLIISAKFFFIVWRNIKNDDIVVTVTNPAINLLFLSVLKKMKRISFIIIVHDVFPENLVVAGISDEDKLEYKILKYLFDYSYNKGDKLITLGRDMQKLIQKKVRNIESVLCIQNFSNVKKIFPLPKNENLILIENQIVDKFVVLFTGNFGRMQNISRLFEAIYILREDINIHFLFIGDGAFVGKMKHSIKEYALSNVTILPNMSKESENTFLNAGDVGLVSLIPNVHGTGVPSKSYSYMAAGKPILAFLDEDSEIALMILEEDIGWIINPNNSMDLVNKIRDLKNKKDEVCSKGRKARLVAEEKYSLEIITERYSKAILS